MKNVYNSGKTQEIISYIDRNIKILEDQSADDLDKDISRMLIKEEVDCLIKDFLTTVILGTTEQVLEFEKSLKYVRDMLFLYLAKTHNDIEINKVYDNLLFII